MMRNQNLRSSTMTLSRMVSPLTWLKQHMLKIGASSNKTTKFSATAKLGINNKTEFPNLTEV
jgi:hypothetical protein